MKPTKLTLEILQKLEPSEIIYAEFAEDGAMGACGTARIFVLNQESVIFYLVDARAGKSEEATWAEVYSRLHRLAERGDLEEKYAGFGNTAWKASDVKFLRDDDAASFIYQKGSQNHQIPASNPGVYSHIVAKFASREISLECLEKYLNQKYQGFSAEERSFFQAYLDQCKRVDAGADWFDFTIEDYLGAVAYIRHLDGTEYILSQDDLADCMASLQKYRLRYAVEKIGWNRLNKFFAVFALSGQTKLFKELSKFAEEDFAKLLIELETIQSSCTELGAAESHNIKSLFAYRPVLVDFSKEANVKIINQIQELSPASLCSDAESIAFYLANYLLHENEWPLSEVLPAAFYIVKNIPLGDLRGTHADQLLWAAGEIINDAWKFLEEKEETQKKYRDLVYNSYWPRIGSLWPVVNYDRFEFKDEVTHKMFNDILSFVICLEDLTERNAEFKLYLKDYAPSKHYPQEMLRRRAFTESLKGLSAREQFNRIMAFESDIAWFYLTYPDDTDDAKILLDEIFRKKNNRFTEICKFATLEGLILTPNTMGVGKYILNYLNDHFEELVDLVYAAEDKGMGLDFKPETVLTDLFVAMSKGITEENEFPAFKSIGEKLLQRGADDGKIKSALAYARRHRRAILFQRSSLVNIF